MLFNGLLGIAIGFCCMLGVGAELELVPVRVAPGVYVVLGHLDPASYDNDALTVNLGFVATSAGVVVIDSGPSYRVAQMLHRAIQRVSSYPVLYVINTGSEPARWLGNSYFKKLGVPLLAHEDARKLMEARGPDQLKAMQTLQQEKAHGTELALPRGFSGDTEEVRFSDSRLQLSYFGAAQSPGNIAVWLPREEIVFAGAIMQSDALPALTADSRLANWLAAYDGVASLRPRQIVPGRGTPGNLARMDADTRAYLARLRVEIELAAQHGASRADIPSRIGKSKEMSSFTRLKGYAGLAPENILQALREMETR